MAISLAIHERTVSGVTVLDLEGDITIGQRSDTFKAKLEELIQRGERRILLNLAHVTKIDSTGISALVRAYVTLYRQQGALKLLKPAGYVRHVLHVTSLFERIESFEDETAALSSFG